MEWCRERAVEILEEVELGYLAVCVHSANDSALATIIRSEPAKRLAKTSLSLHVSYDHIYELRIYELHDMFLQFPLIVCRWTICPDRVSSLVVAWHPDAWHPDVLLDCVCDVS